MSARIRALVQEAAGKCEYPIQLDCCDILPVGRLKDLTRCKSCT